VDLDLLVDHCRFAVALATMAMAALLVLSQAKDLEYLVAALYQFPAANLYLTVEILIYQVVPLLMDTAAMSSCHRELRRIR